MSDSLESAKEAVRNNATYKSEFNYTNVEDMGFTIHGLNEAVQTELC